MARRGIPPVRRWIVNYWRNGRVFHTVKVETINKRFAGWLANDACLAVGKLSALTADKRTVSLSKYQER